MMVISSILRKLRLYPARYRSRFCNYRHDPYLFRDTLLRLLATSNLEYKELTKEKTGLRNHLMFIRLDGRNSRPHWSVMRWILP